MSIVRKGYAFLLSSILVGSLSLLAHPAYAGFPLPPRVSALALASDYTVGQADVMLPVRGNANQNLYVDPALSYGTDNQNEFDVGVGYRWIANQAAIVGGYLYGGYSRVDNNARLWIVNPGIEALGTRWDAHLNMYFPMGDRHYTTRTVMVPFFAGHSQFGKMFLLQQYAGSGADIKAAYQLFPGSSLKGYVGSYYFSPAETNNVWGGAAGLEYWLTQGVKLVGSYTYDKLHQSTYALGLGLEWGGTRVHRADPALDERLTDPVERNLAELGRGSTIPTRLKTKPMITAGSTELTLILQNNMAFFSQTGGPNNGGLGLTLANCTFENPCGPTDFSQASVNTLASLLPNTQLYFNGGTYTTSSAITLVPGQSLRSRTADYSQPATGAARSTILSSGTIGLQGNNILENMILSARINLSAGVNITGSNNTITGSQIGLTGSIPSIGINDSSSNNTRIDNSIIAANDVGVNGNASSNITIQNSELNISFNDNITGASFSNGSTASIINSTINVGSTDFTSIGVIANSGSRVGIINSSISMSNGFPTVIGLQANGSGSLITMMGGTIQLSQQNSQISSSTSGGSVIFQGGTICTVAANGVSCA